MKYTIVKMSEIAKHPTMRLDARYWIKKKKKIKKAASLKLQAPSTIDKGSGMMQEEFLISFDGFPIIKFAKPYTGPGGHSGACATNAMKGTFYD